MADDFVANPGAGGDTFAADDIAGVKFPRAKIVIGSDGVNGGDVSAANPLPVSDAGGSLTVDGTVTASGVTGAAAHDAAVSGNPVLIAGAASAAAPASVSADGDVVRAWMLRNGAQATVVTAAGALIGGDAANGLDVDVTRLPALAAGTNNIGDVDVLTLPATPAGGNLIGRTNPEPQTANGLSISRVVSAASTNATSAKASAGQVYTVIAHNTNAAVRYLKLYNKASAPTVGTDTPVLTLPIPGNTAGAGFVLDTGGMGIAFGTGIAYALTTGVADSDTAAVAANEIVVNVLYK